MDIQANLQTYISNELLNGTVEVDASDNLLTDGMVDSLGMLKLVNHIEELLKIKIPHSDLIIDNFRTIEVIAAYLRRRDMFQTIDHH